MKLTHRQETFICNLLDLYRELNGPIHYSIVAQRIGVSPFTAYDMLRLLEDKGYVKSEYHLGSEKPTVGRSEIFFSPTELANQRFTELSNGSENDDWENLKTTIISRIQAGNFQDHEIAEEMIARVPPDTQDALGFCLEVLAMLFFKLSREHRRQILTELLHEFILKKKAITRSNLLLMSGFFLGLLADENILDFKKDKSLLDLVERYQNIVIEMEPQICRRLGNGLKDMFAFFIRS